MIYLGALLLGIGIAVVQNEPGFILIWAGIAVLLKGIVNGVESD